MKIQKHRPTLTYLQQMNKFSKRTRGVQVFSELKNDENSGSLTRDSSQSINYRKGRLQVLSKSVPKQSRNQPKTKSQNYISKLLCGGKQKEPEMEIEMKPQKSKNVARKVDPIEILETPKLRNLYTNSTFFSKPSSYRVPQPPTPINKLLQFSQV